MQYHTISNVILFITSGTLWYVSVSDFKEYKIPNWSILLLIGLFLAHAFFSGRWISIHFNLGLALIIFVFSAIFTLKARWAGAM